MTTYNPYKAPAGPELDHAVAQLFFPAAEVLLFSRQEAAANKLKKEMERLFRSRIRTGLTQTNIPAYFARLDTDPSTSTEVIAETYPLAITRLAAVLSHSRRSRN